MIGWILLFVLFILVIGLFIGIPCGCKNVKQSLVDTDNIDNKTNVDVNITTPDIINTIDINPIIPVLSKLRTNNWWDFHKCSGKPTYAPGTLPTFGLWTTKDRLNSPDCKVRGEFEWPFKLPCTETHYGFPVECNKCMNKFGNQCTGTNCRIKTPFEDSIYWL